MDPQYPQDFIIVWDGTQTRPPFHTKGELLGPYTVQDAPARFNFSTRRKRTPTETDDQR